MKRAIYTVITNDYDNLAPIDAPCDCILFTDNPEMKVQGWETRVTDIPQREVKLFPFLLLKNYSSCIYMDGNLTMNAGTYEAIDKLLSEHDFINTKHPDRNCVYEEIKQVVKLKKDDLDVLDSIRFELLKEGVEPQGGMIASAFIARNVTSRVISDSFNWEWHHKRLGGKRDQISFALANHYEPLEMHLLDYSYTFGTLFKLGKHKGK